MKKFLLLGALALLGSLSMWASDSESGHYLYFKNTDNAWNAVYLRIGRADHVYTRAFTRIGDSDWWKCETPDYDNFTHFTITDNSDATAPVTTYPSGANRLYEYTYDLKENRWFTLNGNEPAGTSGGCHYWANTDSKDPLATKYSITANKYVFYDNTQTQWENVYLRVGRSDAVGMSKHCATYAFTQIGETNYWYLKTSEYNDLQAWTITNMDANSGMIFRLMQSVSTITKQISIRMFIIKPQERQPKEQVRRGSITGQIPLHKIHTLFISCRKSCLVQTGMHRRPSTWK